MDIAWFSLLLLWLLVIIFSFHTVWQKSQLDKVLIILIGLAWVLTVWGGITQEYEIIEMGHIMFGITLGIMLFFSQSKIMVCVGIITVILTLLYRWYYGSCAYHRMSLVSSEEIKARESVTNNLPSWEQLAFLLIPIGFLRLYILQRRDKS